MIWALSFDCKNVDPYDLLNRLDDRITLCGLERNVGRIAIQLLGWRNGRNADFLLYLVLASQQKGMVPERIRETLFGVQGMGSPHTSCTIDEFDGVYGEWEKLNRGKVPYRRPESPVDPSLHLDPSQDWLDLAQTDEDEESLLLETQRYDRLLRYLSAKGEGSWSSFVGTCAGLWGDVSTVQPAWILRSLSRLGHLIVSPDRSRWRIAPPLLVRRPDIGSEEGSAVYVLCGARDDVFLARWKGSVPLQEVPQPAGDGPAAVLIEVDREDEAALEDRLGVLCCRDLPACLSALPTLSKWRSSLPFLGDLPLYEYQLEFFQGMTFTSCSAFRKAPGLYRFLSLPSRPEERPVPQFLRYYDPSRDGWLKGSTTDLRFLSHLDHGWEGGFIPLSRTSSDWTLPSHAQLPGIYEQPLAIASGFLPFRRTAPSGDRLLVYREVPRVVIDLVADRLGWEAAGGSESGCAIPGDPNPEPFAEGVA